MAELEVRNIGTQPVKVGDRTIAIGETARVEGATLSVSNAEAPAPIEPTDDVWSEGNRPNGPVTAAIAPKLPKSSGELVQVPVPGQEHRSMERAPVERGQAEQGGGPDSKDTVTTPGPQPDPAPALGGAREAVGTGAADLRGQPKDVSKPQARTRSASSAKRAGKARR